MVWDQKTAKLSILYQTVFGGISSPCLVMTFGKLNSFSRGQYRPIISFLEKLNLFNIFKLVLFESTG